MTPIASILKSTLSSLPDPIYPAPNLTLFFPQTSGAILTDPVTGNKYQAETTTNLIVKASVTEDGRNPTDSIQAGIKLYNLYVIGRCVEPKVLPIEINLQSRAIAELKDLASGRIESGEFRFMPTVQNRFPELVAKMGTFITGYMIIQSSDK